MLDINEDSIFHHKYENEIIEMSLPKRKLSTGKNLLITWGMIAFLIFFIGCVYNICEYLYQMKF